MFLSLRPHWELLNPLGSFNGRAEVLKKRGRKRKSYPSFRTTREKRRPCQCLLWSKGRRWTLLCCQNLAVNLPSPVLLHQGHPHPPATALTRPLLSEQLLFRRIFSYPFLHRWNLGFLFSSTPTAPPASCFCLALYFSLALHTPFAVKPSPR